MRKIGINRLRICNIRRETAAKQASGEEGTAIVIALLIMLLLMGFVALAVSRTSNEIVASANDAAETRTFEATQASLEIMTQNFDKIFDTKLNPDTADITRVEGQFPDGPDGFTNDYDFNQRIIKSRDSEMVIMTGQQFQGLSALRDEWELDSTATDKNNGVQVRLKRKFFNNRIPIFQFGVFYEDDLEFHPGPRFDFGGRVHTNKNLFLRANELYFDSKISSVGEIFTDVMRNGNSTGGYVNTIHIKNGSGTYVNLDFNMGSVLRDVAVGSPKINEPDMPVAYANANWATYQALFDGNLLANQRRLDLPLRVASGMSGAALDYIEIIKRGKEPGDLFNDDSGTAASPSILPVTAATADTVITAQERFSNKNGIRVSLADSKAKLPGCASGIGTNAVTTACGVRLDGDAAGDGDTSSSFESRGYRPRPMKDGYQATRINGERFHRGTSVETWIKIETVRFDLATNTVVTQDITHDLLSLGVTSPAPVIIAAGSTVFSIQGYGNTDSRSIFKLQRFIFGNGRVEAADTNFISMSTWNGVNYNYVIPAANDGALKKVDDGPCASLTTTDINYHCHSYSGLQFGDHQDHWKQTTIGTSTDTHWIVPFPIKMFDVREGVYNDSISLSATYGATIPWAGVMSLVDVDIANLKRFLDGNFDASMPDGTPYHAANGASLTADAIPDANGWVLYISDRRGDFDFDGEYDMEDVYGNNDGILQFGEDVNDNGILEADYAKEAPRYTGSGSSIAKGIAATLEQKFYRRGVRLINAQTLPGFYDAVTPENTKGFTVASENGIYVLGNFNATGISAVGTPTASVQYIPQNTTAHVPASIAADAVTILSNAWSDGNGFANAFNRGGRSASETTIRFAMIAGDARSSLIEAGEPDQGGGDLQLTGGVHNFKRFLETWGTRLNYSGSMINLYNARNNNAPFKCCTNVYSPPTRNWVFDSSFLNPNRLPPGTPFFQTIQLTGFQRMD